MIHELKRLKLNDGTFDWRPQIPVIARNPRNPEAALKRTLFLVDSGATSCMLRGDLLKQLQMHAKPGRLRTLKGLHSSQGLNAIYHEVTLSLDPFPPFEVEAAFVDDLPVAGILGRQGFFDRFRIVFHGLSDPPALEFDQRP